MRFVLAMVLAFAAWIGIASAQAAVHIQVDLTSQSMHVASSEGDYTWAVSTGRAGHRTPTGVYRPQRMYPLVYSAKYNNAPMPHAIFFTGGYAIHATYETAALGRVASHGCVRLSPENATRLYELVKREGALIEITGTAPGGGLMVAHAKPHRHHATALAYAPHKRHHVRTLQEWSHNPFEMR